MKLPSWIRRKFIKHVQFSPVKYRAHFRFNICKRILIALERDYENQINEYCIILDEDEAQELLKIMRAIVKEGE